MIAFCHQHVAITPMLRHVHEDIEQVAFYDDPKKPGTTKPRRNTTREADGPVTVKDIGDLSQSIKFGASGWNVEQHRSEWGGADFDGLNHAIGLTPKRRAEIIEILKRIPWLQIQLSRSTEGFHIFWFWREPPRAMSRAQHKANCRRVILLIEQLTGLDLTGKDKECDVAGAILFLWAADRKPDSFKVIQTAEGFVPDDLPELPATPIPVINNVNTSGFDEDHQEIVRQWSESGFAVHVQHHDGKPSILLHIKACESGPDKTYRTNSPGSDPRTANGFGLPLPGGKILIGKFGDSPEPAPWFKSAKGNWVCVYGESDIATKAGIGLRSYNGSHLGTVEQIAAIVPIEVGEFGSRPATLKRDNNQWVVSVDSKKSEELPPGWMKVGYKAVTFVDALEPRREPEQLYIVRERKTSEGQDVGDWMMMERGVPTYFKSDAKINAELRRRGYGKEDIAEMKDSAIPIYKRIAHLRSFVIEGEYLNNGAKLRVTPAPGPHPTWDAVEERLGSLLTPYISLNDWCQKNNILTGGQYLRLIRAIMFQHPDHPLPYLALYSRQGGTGKTFWVESVGTILIEGGVVGAAKFLSGGAFNGHIATSLLAFIAETDVAAKGAYDKLKALITDEMVESEAKHQNSTVERNHCHFVQLCNKLAYIPVEPEDRRVVVVPVPSLTPRQPGDELLSTDDRLAQGKWVHGDELKERLIAEAPAYLHTLTTMELPPRDSALWVPIISTKERDQLIEMRTEPVKLFIDRHTTTWEHSRIPLKEFLERFGEWYPEIMGDGATLAKSDITMALRRLDGEIKFVRNNSHGSYITNAKWKDN